MKLYIFDLVLNRKYEYTGNSFAIAKDKEQAINLILESSGWNLKEQKTLRFSLEQSPTRILPVNKESGHHFSG